MNKLKMKEHNEPGLLISFCGLDGCGKSTMISMLNEYLQALGYETFITIQPTKEFRRSPAFRTYMDSPDHTAYDYRALSLAATSDRIQHSNHEILPQLRAGKCVICDRYFYSCLANLRARGYKNDQWIYEVSEAVPKPDIAFFLDIPVKEALARVRSRPEERDRYIDVPLQYALRDEYLDICTKNDGILIASNLGADNTFKQVKHSIDNYFANNKKKGKPTNE